MRRSRICARAPMCGGDSFRAFAAQRADLLMVLTSLAPDAWSRTATVTGPGKPHTVTVLSYAERLAVHERRHLEQFARIATVMRAAGRCIT
jgi:hypothetical protein